MAQLEDREQKRTAEPRPKVPEGGFENGIEKVLDLETIDRNLFRGPVVPSLFTRTFGGQVAAQALVAATRSADPAYKLHSLHSYFLRPGNPKQPTIFEVETLREGRSFSVCQVAGIQDGKVIFNMHASFHIRGDEGIVHSDQMPNVADPDSLPPAEGLTPGQRALLGEWTNFDLRVAQLEDQGAETTPPTRQLVWFKAKNALPDDENFHMCTLTYMSDMTLLHSAIARHPKAKVQMASLDHAIWFLRPFRADEWLLYDQVSPSAAHGRALTQGQVFNHAGELVAVVTQEGLTRFFNEPK